MAGGGVGVYHNGDRPVLPGVEPMRRLVSFVVLFAGLTALATAQDANPDAKAWVPPVVPDGWRAVAGKDGTFRFAVPKATVRTGSRDRTVTVNGVRSQTLIHYATLADGTGFEVHVATLAGAKLKDFKTSEVTGMFLAAEQDAGFEVTLGKAVAVGDLKGHEYRLTKDNVSRRMWVLLAKPRLVFLNVTATDEDQLDSEAAETFLKSFVLVPPEVVAAANKQKAVKDAKLAKEKAVGDDKVAQENFKKYGFKWTLDLKEMTAPDAPVVGTIGGREFKPDAVTLTGGQLVFRQGAGFFAELEAGATLFLKGGETVENRTYELSPAKGVPQGSPFLYTAVMAKDAKLPTRETFTGKYALKLTFGAKADDGIVPGTIYFCAPDATRSYFAGTFNVTVK